MKSTNYYIYIIRCEDNSLYTGITTDLKRRFEEHLSNNTKSAKYTRTHRPKSIEKVWQTDSRASASKLEYAIKQLPKKQKEDLILNLVNLESILSEKSNNYKLYISD